jgi:hypothetical protein
MRRSSMQVGAVKHELRVFGGRQFFRDVILVVAGEKVRSWNHAGRRTQPPSVGVIDIHVRVRIVHQRREIIDAYDRKLIRLFRFVVKQRPNIKRERRRSGRENNRTDDQGYDRAAFSNMHLHIDQRTKHIHARKDNYFCLPSSNRDPTSTQGKLRPASFLTLGAGVTPA